MKIKIRTISILVIVSILGACTPINNLGQDDTNNTALLETQNALLLQQIQALQAQHDQTSSDSTGGESLTRTQIPQPKATEVLSIQEVTPEPETLPTYPIPAGQPVTFDGWSITVSKEIYINSNKGLWGVDILVKNLSQTDRVFRFTNSAITASDDLGNVYQLSDYGGFRSCDNNHYQVKNLSIKSLDGNHVYSGDYCDRCREVDGIGSFIGPIPVNANQLIIRLSEFGPFSGVTFVITL
ncbi:MAG: hypothetical protein VB026_07305 [Anaerolineaceae bacterium]|nr:hypothetical protein [Anaerolineaceae bacterium]